MMPLVFFRAHNDYNEPAQHNDSNSESDLFQHGYSVYPSKETLDV